MPTTRYALFETKTSTPAAGVHGAGLIARDIDIDLGFGLAGADSPVQAADTLTFKTTAEASACGRNQTMLRVPRIPIRLIPHALAGNGAAGSPWGIEAIGAHQSAFTGAGVCVAVLDSGIDAGHPAFAGLITADNYKDFTGTGLVDTVGHGTHCAGIIFGRDVGGTRIGVARGVTQVLIGKIADQNTVTTTEQLEDALMWAVRKGADVISMSIGLDFLGHTKQLQAADYPPEAALVAALADYRDYAKFFDSLLGRIISPGAAGRSALVVAAVGNDSHADGTPAYRVGATLPAVADKVVAVGALGQDGGKLTVAPFSNVDANVCAPGVAILSACPGGGLATLSGTSQAAPHVAGAAALWWEKLRGAAFARPEPAAVRERMLGQSDFESLSPPAAAEEIGMGLVRAP